MRTGTNLNIWLVMCCLSVRVVGTVNTTLAEEPVYFADANLKAAVEQALGITDPTPTDMLALITLDAHGEGITDLTGLEYVMNLTELWLYDNQIGEISALAGLTNLQVLWLGYNEVSDISAVAGLTNLTKLGLYSNQIRDISPLSGLTNLQNLFLEWNQVSDIWPLSGLTTLQYLRLYRNQISDISAVAGLTNLTKLDLDWNKISDISAIAGLTNLIHLNLSSNQISDISALSGLTNMKELLLHDNRISDISGVTGLTNLTHLGLYGNRISDISAVAGLTNLVWLGLDNNHVSDVSALLAMTNLIQLDLRGNPLNQSACDIYIPLIVANNPGISLHYDKRTLTLTISSTAGGSVSVPGEGVFPYDHGSTVPIVASADTRHHFVNWTGTAVDAGKVADPSAASTTVIVNADYTLRANFVTAVTIIYVDDDAAGDLGPNNPGISDPSENGTLAHPYDMVQEGIDATEGGDTVLVYPGVYTEEINFLGKDVMVQGVATTDGVPVLENPGDFAVSFYSGEGPDSVLKNFVIKNSFMAVFIAGSSPTISNVTVVGNKYGIEAFVGSEPDISSSIFWSNTAGDLFGCQAKYSWIQEDIERGPIEGLISHWKFDEGSGTIAHDPVGDNHGTIYGAQWTSGLVGGCLSFDGDGDYVMVGDKDSLEPQELTLSFWAKLSYPQTMFMEG